jgi:hypothetical protein
VDDSLTKSYYAFLSEIPSDYQGVESVAVVGDKINIEEYGHDQERTIELDFHGILTGIDTPGSLPSQQFVLSQNHPNPFHKKTLITYCLPDEGHTHLEVFSASGQSIRILVDEYQEAGNHQVTFHAAGLPGGLYFYRITSGNLQQQGKMILLNR